MDISFRRYANVLALVATLALALVPTLGRGWMASHAQSVVPMHGAHHGAHAANDHAGGRDVPSGADCDYCLIAAGMALADVAVAPHTPSTHGAAVLPTASDSPARDIARRGLGARGPPDLG